MRLSNLERRTRKALASPFVERDGDVSSGTPRYVTAPLSLTANWSRRGLVWPFCLNNIARRPDSYTKKRIFFYI